MALLDRERTVAPTGYNPAPASAQPVSGRSALLVAAWTGVALPLAWGVWTTVTKSLALFR